MLLILFIIHAVKANLFYSYGLNNEKVIPTGVDIFHGPISLSTRIVFFNKIYSEIYVHSDGFITLSNETRCGLIEYPDPRSTAIVAYWEQTNTVDYGSIIFKEISQPNKLNSMSRLVSQSFTKYNRFFANYGFMVTWFEVPKLNGEAKEKNTFQIIVLTNGKQTFALLNYFDMRYTQIKYKSTVIQADNKIQYSMFSNSKFLENQSNVNLSGLWIFRVDGEFSVTKYSKNIKNNSFFLLPNLYLIILLISFNKV